MKGGLPTTLALFAKFIARIMGLHFTEERHLELSQKMAAVAKDAGFSDLEQYLLWLMSAPLSREQLETLASALTIGETYFLRDPGSYQILEQQLLPGLVARRRGSDQALRIWSAGCSTGEEPYTLAIILSRVIPDLANWNISLTGTDINPQALERGRQGIYGSWSFRNAPPWLMDYFTRLDDGRFQVIPRIRALVRFEHLNLADAGSGPEGSGTSFLDLVFCRNVMLYFEQIQIERTMRRFHAALREGGWLFVGPTEVDQSLMKGFTCQRFTGALVLRKGADQAHGAAAHPSAAGRLPSPHRLPSAAGAVPAASAPAPAPVPSSGATHHDGIILRLRFNQDSWLSITIDDSISQRYDLKAGDVIEWKGAHSFVLDIGDGAAAEAEFNGRPLKALGEAGKPAHVELKEGS